MPSAWAKALRTSRPSRPRISRAQSQASIGTMQEQPKRQPAPSPAKNEPSPGLKLIIELGPLIVFFGANAAYGIYAATGAFMAATLLSLAVALMLYGKLPIMPLVSG